MATTKKRAHLSREGKVERWSAWAGLIPHDADLKTSTRKSMSIITLYGRFDEPVKGVSQFEMVFREGLPVVGPTLRGTVGVFLDAKPKLAGHLTLHPSEFQMMLTLATSGNLRYLCCSFQEPHYGKGLITSLDFGSENPDA